ncbi:Gfo/Idh/MocA family oxidoreductase [Psychromarinibacter sp. C21-152]|uniref:Gfo/Idh/MocA family oxidoreductase n=1 Tax=Psychromarinibacter sediminicola TaxID=3033385 RepID=A0AAE3NQH4_9RHOB|nr:Gfo/Idh/MocA family oxidoreductase [Psychromarinibacter sediminicola]MDF0601663.1 Gfo/Idh/MocA family oxidoreductase [Psychromarinibacter sediminicola]
MADLRIAVIGAGIIGRTHIETLGRVEGMALSAIADPDPAAKALADARGVPFFAEAADLIAARVADAVVVAAPNDAHLPLGLELLAAGLPVLMEKPVTASLAEGAELVAAVERTGVPVLVGHHRRHNPIIKAAKAAIEAGEIGELVTATVMSVLTKPAPYFAAWRVVAGQGGPLLINTTHEIDLLRHFFGPVAQVTAVTSNAQRDLPVEDTAAAILSFERGGLATITQTDAAAGPWAWDVTAGENLARFPAHDTIAHAYAGTKAALSLPDLSLWRHPGPPDWTVEMRRTALPHTPGDAYVAQLAHFGAVARGEAEPLNSAADGLGTMTVVEAIRRSAAEARQVSVAELAP